MKRCLDIFSSFVLLLLLFFPFLLLAVFVYARLGWPLIFSQMRPGINGRSFKMFKIRTMTDARDSNGNLLQDWERVTKFGQSLRAMSLDELPGLWNVLKGDMSLVGPRPLLVEYLPLYSDRQTRRHEVRPGITGWAQVNGRNALSWEEKFELDIWYVDNRTFALDCRIIWMTALKVLQRDGISAAGEVTMSRFTGNTAVESEV